MHPDSGEDVFEPFRVMEEEGPRPLQDGGERDFEMEATQKGSPAIRVLRK